MPNLQPYPDEPEPEPGPDAVALLLLEDENRRLRATAQQMEGALRKLEASLRAAGRVLEPYLRAINGEPR